MCSSFVPVMTLLATLLHSVLGCCWHHVHACECDSVGPMVRAVSVETAHKHSCCGDRADATPCQSSPVHGDDASGEPGAPQHQHPGCAESHCVFVSSRTQDGCWTELLAVAFDLPPLMAVTPPTSGVTSGVLDFPDEFPATARHWRAQLQVWLI